MKMSFEKPFFLAFFPKRNDIVNEVDKKLAHKAKPFGVCAAGGWALNLGFGVPRGTGPCHACGYSLNGVWRCQQNMSLNYKDVSAKTRPGTWISHASGNVVILCVKR